MDELQKKLDEVTNQLAVEQLRADQAEDDVKKEKARADALEGERDGLKTKLAQVEKERNDAKSEDVEGLKKKVTILTSQVAQQKKRADEATSPANINKLVQERTQLIVRAGAVLGAETRLDELTNVEIQKLTVKKLQGHDLEGKSDEYIRARFDSAMESYGEGLAMRDRVRELADEAAERNKGNVNNRADAASARQKFLDEQNNAWKTKQEGN